MNVRVLLFASLRELAATGELALELDSDAQVGEVLARLRERMPKAEGLLDRSALAVNEEYASANARLRDGDVVAVIPPVSGGANGSETAGPVTERGV